MHNLIGYRTTLSFFFCQSVITLCIVIQTSRIETVLPTMNDLLKNSAKTPLIARTPFGILIPKYLANYSGV